MKNNLRLLITTSTFPVTPGDGVPRFVLDLADALSARTEVHVLAPDAPGAALEESIGGVHVNRFSYAWPRSSQRLAITNQRGMRDNIRGSLLAKAQVLTFLLRQAAVLKQMVRDHDIDVVNAHWIVPQGLVAAWTLRRSTQVKLVLHVHAGDVYLLQRMLLGRCIARYVVKRTSAIFAAGSHVRDALDGLLGFDSGAVLQPMGVNSAQFSDRSKTNSEPPTKVDDFPDGFVLFVGRLVEKKGTIYLIRALKHLHKTNPKLGLVIVGFGPEEAALRAEVETLGLQKHVRFAGRKTHDEIVELLHACRASAVPSIIDSRGETEGMPTVVVEALAAGVPVVGSNVNGIPDVIRHAENGWLCREKDPEDLAQKLQIALACDRQQIQTAATQTAEQHDWQQVAKNYLNRIAELSD